MLIFLYNVSNNPGRVAVGERMTPNDGSHTNKEGGAQARCQESGSEKTDGTQSDSQNRSSQDDAKESHPQESHPQESDSQESHPSHRCTEDRS